MILMSPLCIKCNFNCLLRNLHNPPPDIVTPYTCLQHPRRYGTWKDQAVSFYHSLLKVYLHDADNSHQQGPLVVSKQLHWVLLYINHTKIVTTMGMESHIVTIPSFEEMMAKMSLAFMSWLYLLHMISCTDLKSGTNNTCSDNRWLILFLTWQSYTKYVISIKCITPRRSTYAIFTHSKSTI